MNETPEDRWLALDRSTVCDDFLDQLKDESERALAIVAAAALDEMLRRVLEKTVVNQRIAIRLFNRPYAPLGTFSARIDAAYGFRIIDRELYRVLNTIRDIRNKFAHEINWSFNEESTRDKCLAMHLPHIVYPEGMELDPRIRFQMNATGICGYLDGLLYQWGLRGFSLSLLAMNDPDAK